MPSDPFEWWEMEHYGIITLDGSVTKEPHKEYHEECPFCNKKLMDEITEEM